MNRLHVTIALVAAALLAGCQPTMDIPADFVPVEGWEMQYPTRAVSADGVVVALREPYDNPKNGTVEFWAAATKGELLQRGYKLQSSEEITSRAGLKGRLMTFSADVQGTPFAYLLAVFVDKGRVLVAEAGGKADSVKPKAGALRQAFLSVR